MLAGCIAAVVFALASTTAVFGSTTPRRLQQTYTLEIAVECFDTAVQAVMELNGYNLHFNETVSTHWGMFVNTRQAVFTRRVDDWAFPHAQYVLRGLGEILNEHENARHLGAEISDTEVRLSSVNREIERLMLMMAASTTLDVLIAIDNQLSHIMWERDRLIGRRNLLLHQATSPVLFITIVEYTDVTPDRTPPTFGRRIADSFLRSWGNFLTGAGNLAVFLARTALPFVIWTAIISVLGLTCFRVYKKFLRKLKHKPAINPSIEENEKKDGEDNEA